MRIHEAVEKALKEKSPITRTGLRDFGFGIFPTDSSDCCYLIRNRSRKQKTKQKETERIRKRKAMKTGALQSFRSFCSSCVKIFRNVSGSLVASKTNRMNVASLPQKRKHPVIMPCKKSFMKWRKRRLMRRYRKKFSNIFKRN